MTEAKQKSSKNSPVLSIKKAKGNLENVLKMVENGEFPCKNVLQQIDSVIGLLKSAKNQVVNDHLCCCLENISKTDNVEEKVKEIQDLYKLSNKDN